MDVQRSGPHFDLDAFLAQPLIVHLDKRDAAWFNHEIAPKLDVPPVQSRSPRQRVYRSVCSRIRAGKKVSHPRHWDMLEAFIKLQWVVESRRVGLREAPCRK
jgi:hypothetical protein